MGGYEWEAIGIAFLLTLFAGLSTGIGAVMAFMLKNRSTVPLSVGLGFSAGVMIYISLSDILPLAQGEFAHYVPEAQAEMLALAAFLGGVVLTAIIDRLIPDDINPHELRPSRDFTGLKPGGVDHTINLRRTGIFTAVAIAVHNFPEGFATFVTALNNPTLGVAIAFAIAIHNIPEGIAVSLPIYHATGKKREAFWYSFASGLAEPLGALLGFMLLAPFLNPAVMGASFALVAGIMVYISFDELLPAARVYGNAHSSIFGVVAGIMVMALSMALFKLM
jgi:ZIP family zinc transporter